LPSLITRRVWVSRAAGRGNGDWSPQLPGSVQKRVFVRPHSPVGAKKRRGHDLYGKAAGLAAGLLLLTLPPRRGKVALSAVEGPDEGVRAVRTPTWEAPRQTKERSSRSSSCPPHLHLRRAHCADTLTPCPSPVEGEGFTAGCRGCVLLQPRDQTKLPMPNPNPSPLKGEGGPKGRVRVSAQCHKCG